MRFLFIILLTFSLVAFTPRNVLKLKRKLNYSETISCAITNNNLHIEINTDYNRKSTVDEEFTNELLLVIPSIVKKGDVLEINRENPAIQCNYEFSSVWIWPQGDRKTNMKGKIKITDRTDSTLVLDFNIKTVRGEEPSKITYKGKRKIRL